MILARTGRLLAVVAALLAVLPSVPAAAASGSVTVTVTPRWGLTGTWGTWTPYVATVRNGGAAELDGELDLLPLTDRWGAAGSYPVHRSALVVPPGASRSVTVYTVDAPAGYRAVVRDGSGREVAQADPSGGAAGTSAVAVLSDVQGADEKITGPLAALARSGTVVTRFQSAQAFPADAVYLTGLNGIVLDDFDTASLSQAQLQALQDFVGLGGFVIEAGGAAWRRTLLPLPAALLPLAPQATVTAPVDAIADVAGGEAAGVTAPVAQGALRGGREVLAAADGTALMVESAFGAGIVEEMTFDPLDQPFGDQVGLAAMAWSQALARGLSGVQGADRSLYGGYGAPVQSTAGGGPPVAGPGVWAPGFGIGAEQLSQVLNSAPGPTAPPVGLLGGLLIAYVLLAGLLNYTLLKAAGRRDLMWITVPALAVLATAGAYAVGFATRGAAVYETEVQVERLAPGGAVETFTFDYVFSPHRGDVGVELPPDTLASTAISVNGLSGVNEPAVVSAGRLPSVLLRNVPVWTPSPLQLLDVSHSEAGPAATEPGLVAHLRLQQGHIRGQVGNRTGHAVTQLELIGSTGDVAFVGASIAPGETVTIDSPLEQTPGSVLTTGLPVGPGQAGSRPAVLRLAASEALSQRPGDLALVGISDGHGLAQVEGMSPTRAAVTAVVVPVRLESIDNPSALHLRPRLVSTFPALDGSGPVDVYDVDLPSPAAGVGLLYQLPAVQPGQSAEVVRSVEVYDWLARTWRSLPRQAAASRGPQAAALKGGEAAGGMVRVRVRETAAYQAQLALSP